MEHKDYKIPSWFERWFDFFSTQNIEEELVEKTLEEIRRHDGLLQLLETQPRLEDVIYGKVSGDTRLRRDEIFVFFTTFVELQKLLRY